MSGRSSSSKSGRVAKNDPVARLRRSWRSLGRLPGGKWLFSRMVGRAAPYTGTIKARVEELDDGYARLTMRDRKKVRNHLRSVHAVAQLNLAEETSGLAIVFSMPPGHRGIPIRLEIDYQKKARGTITAECRVPGGIAPLPEGQEKRELEVDIVLTDPLGETVSEARARWVMGRTPAG